MFLKSEKFAHWSYLGNDMNDILKTSNMFSFFSIKASMLIFAFFIILSFCPHFTSLVIYLLKLVGWVGLIISFIHIETITRYLNACATNSTECEMLSVVCKIAQIIIQVLLISGSVLFIVGTSP